MKVLITTLNSKFIHSSLSIRYLKSYCKDVIPDIEIVEYTINQDNAYISGEIYKQNPDIVAFSCYIWNIENILDIVERLKIVKPNIKIILGGPEVSYDGEEILKQNIYVDFVVYGEGEETLRELLVNIKDGKNDFSHINGIIYRKEDDIIKNEPRPLIHDLNKIPSPFDGDLSEFKNKIVYYESSRGCPFNCQFCLSSTIKGLRFFAIDRVKSDLEKLINARVKQVKFVDRTFNARKDYALEIMNFIMSRNVKDINFHFEVTAHLLDEEILGFLKDVPEGLFQFEIGVQSTNEKTLNAIDRKTNFQKLSKAVEKIKKYKNVHQHLDLIAGLPYEDYQSFRKSFNDVYILNPDKLQLGFLKLLKGSGLRNKKEKYGFKFIDRPPYEVLENKYISYNEMLKLKVIEDLVEKYSNSEGFENILKFIMKTNKIEPFDFFEMFGQYWEQKKLHENSHSKFGLYKIIYDFYLDKIDKNIDIFKEIVKYDFIYNNKNTNVPDFLPTYNKFDLKSSRHLFLKNLFNVEKYIYMYKDLPAKKIINEVHFEEFKFNIVEFINNGYNLDYILKRDTVILFVYDKNKKVFDKCKTFDVTEEIKKQG